MHVVQMSKLCLHNPWSRVVNYEIAFFQRYYTILNHDTAWAKYDDQFITEYLLLPSVGTASNSNPNSTTNTNVCRKFSEGKYCNQFSCKFAHNCTFDQSRCNGAHTASSCPLNPNRQPPPSSERSNRHENRNYSRPQQQNNPNFTPLRDNNRYRGRDNRDRDNNYDRAPRERRD
jgi:hypothetical protein